MFGFWGWQAKFELLKNEVEQDRRFRLSSFCPWYVPPLPPFDRLLLTLFCDEIHIMPPLNTSIWPLRVKTSNSPQSDLVSDEHQSILPCMDNPTFLIKSCRGVTRIFPWMFSRRPAVPLEIQTICPRRWREFEMRRDKRCKFKPLPVRNAAHRPQPWTLRSKSHWFPPTNRGRWLSLASLWTNLFWWFHIFVTALVLRY